MGKEYIIDPELETIMTELTPEEKAELKQSLLKDGYKGSPIIIWKGRNIIVDGHNRYKICVKNNIPFEIKELEFDSKDAVIQWMIRAQLGRRNLLPSQKIALAEKFRPLYEKEAREHKMNAGGDKKSEEYKKTVAEKLPQPINKERNPTTDKKLADIAGISERTYRTGRKVLESDEEELKKKMLSGEMSINKASSELKKKMQKTDIGILADTDTSTAKGDLNTEVPESDHTTKENCKSRLEKIQKYYKGFLPQIISDIQWLLTKEFYYDTNSEATREIKNTLQQGLEEFKNLDNLILNMEPDDCGDNNVIILKTM